MTRRQRILGILLVVLATLFLVACIGDGNTQDPGVSDSGEGCKHEFDKIAGVAPTCTESGYTEHRVCRLCGEQRGYAVLDPRHTYSTVPEKPATETEAGYTQHRLCGACGYREGYEEIPAVHLHRLTEHEEGETNPLFYHCACGFSVVSDLRSRPLINQLTDAQYEQFLKLYNMMKNRESSCELDLSAAEVDLFYTLLQGQCPELFLLEYENAAPTVTQSGADWNPDCMSPEEYEATCEILIDTMLQWEQDCRGLEDVEKIRYLTHWMVENTDFVTIGTHVRSLYGGIIEREIACVGYAQIMSWALNLFDVPCMSVNGAVQGEGHMWNLVQLNGDWYQVDAGWNYVTFHGTNYSNDCYLNVTDAELRIGSARVYYDFYRLCGITIPTCTATAQNLARLEGRYVQSTAEIDKAFSDAFARACAKKQDVFTLICGTKAIQDAIVSHAQRAGNVAGNHGVKIFWNNSGHDDRTNLYYVSVLIGRPNALETPVTVAQPTAGVGYKLAIRQNANGQILFFSGNATGKYLSTVADPGRATDVFYKEVAGGFRLWFMDGFLKKYVDIAVDEYGSVRAAISLTPTATYRLDPATGAMIATVNGADYWLGTYGDFSTIGASRFSYISGNQASQVGATQFPAQLVTINGVQPLQKEEPPVPSGEGTAYKLVMRQENLGKVLYFQGWRTRNFPASTTDRASSPNIYLEKTEGGYYLYYLWGENKLYLNVQGYSNKGVSVLLRPTPGAVFTYNEKLGLYTVNMYGTEYYLGSYNQYDNFSLSDIRYITGSNADKIGVSQFPAYLEEVEE